jgi:hypothetical protein
MNEFIDIYCERLMPGLWAEPLNAITNLSFFVAAFFAYSLARDKNALDWRSGLLIGLMAGMGIGSTLFHTFATLWAMLSDVLPILFYQICFIVLYNRYVIGLKCWRGVIILAGFFIAMWVSMQLPREWLNGSLEYAPALLFVTGFAVYHVRHARAERWGLLMAAGVFLISLTFRSFDMQACPVVPFGTHFIWHILNGLVLYLCTRAFILNRSEKISCR